jgi:O-antigen ligase
LGNGISLAILVLIWFIHRDYSQFIGKIKKSPWLFGLVIIFLLELVSLTYSQDLHTGLKTIEKNLSFLIVPIIVITSRFPINHWYREMLFAFIAGCTVLCFHFLSQVIMNIEVLFTKQLDGVRTISPIHPTYFSSYLALSIFIIIDYLKNQKEKIRNPGSLLCLLLTIIFIVCIILLGSKLYIFLMPFFISALILDSVFNKKKGVLAGMAIVIGLYFILTISVPTTRERLVQTIEKGLIKEDGKRHSQLTIRFEKWKCSFESISRNPLLGAGIGDAQSDLNKCYRKNKFWGHARNFNSHNQYLQTALEIGLPGLIILLLHLYLVGKTLIHFRYKPLLFALILFVIFNLFESTLSRQKGAVFYAFFSSVILHSRLHRNPVTNIENEKVV